MNLRFRIPTNLRSRTRTPDQDADASIQRLLESQRRALSVADPDSHRQWQRLARRMDSAAPSARVVHRIKRLRPALVGVSLASLAGAVFAIYLLMPDVPNSTNYRTARGEQTSVVLADSSQILLNHTTEISVTLASEARLVTLKGEALFRVRHTGKPFLVRTEAGTVRVLGTEFNVCLREEILEVAVLSGSVHVSAGPDGSGPSVVLSSGEITQVLRGGPPSLPERVLFSEYPGWMHGKLALQRSTVGRACTEIESRFNVTITIEDPALRQETLTGILDARSPEAAVATIARLTGSQYRHEKNAYILY